MSGPSRGRIALLYDCTYPHVAGGGQKRLFEISRRLVTMGWEVDWYGFKAWEGDAVPQIQGIRYLSVAHAQNLYRPDGKRSIFQTLRYGLAVTRFPRIGRYDIVHMGQWPYFHFFSVRLFSLFGGARISVDWWEVWASHWKEYYGVKGYLGMALERVCALIPDRLIAISETGRNQLVQLGVASQNIEVVHNGIDYAAISSAEPETSELDLIYLGRLQPHKNVNLLVEALGILRDRGVSLRLGIIGDGPERESLAKLAERRGVTEQIRWFGSIESDAQVYRILNASRVFVHPSTKEGGGSITSLEANAAGLPVIAFAHPGGISPELILEGINGHWVKNVSANSLADGIFEFLETYDPAIAQEKSRRFAETFDWSGLARSYDEMFSALLTDKKAR